MRSRAGRGECTQGVKERFDVTGQEDRIPLSAGRRACPSPPQLSAASESLRKAVGPTEHLCGVPVQLPGLSRAAQAPGIAEEAFAPWERLWI